MNYFKQWNKIFIERNKYCMNNRKLFYNLALNYLPNNYNSIILDIGSGNSLFIELIKDNYNNIYLLDGNIITVNKLRKKYSNTLYYIAPEKLPFEKSTIDYIHCSHLIEHLYYNELHTFLIEINRVLKNNGILVISTPLLWKGFYNTLTHTKPYNPNIIINYLSGISENLSYPIISNKYSVLNLIYRYEHYSHFKEGYGSSIKGIDFIIQVFKKLLNKFRVYQYNKTGYTLVLKKSE